MTKYVYIVRRIGPDSEVEYEEALTKLDDAKECMRKQIAEYDIWRQPMYSYFTQEKKYKFYMKYKDMPIKLKKSEWRWVYHMGGPFAALFELKRLEIKESI